MSNASDDKLVDEYLTGGTPYSVRYRGIESAEVPAELDGAVLERAREAQAKPKHQRLKWFAPALAIAATAVLTLSIVLRNGVGTSDYRRMETEPSEVVVSRQAPALHETAIEPSASVVAQTPAAPAAKAKVDAIARATSGPRVKERDSGAAESKLLANEPVLANDVLADKKAAPTLAASSPPAAEPERRVLPENMPAAATSARAETPRMASTNGPALLSNAQRLQIDRQRQNAAREKQKVEVESVVDAGSLRRDTSKDATAGEVLSSQELKQRGMTRMDVDRANPANWLEHIRNLRSIGKEAEADEEWNHFVQVFPKYPVARNDSARPK